MADYITTKQHVQTGRNLSSSSLMIAYKHSYEVWKHENYLVTVMEKHNVVCLHQNDISGN